MLEVSNEIFTCRLQLHELEELLYEDDEVDAVTLFPPEDGEFTDEDSGDEAEGDINRLPGRILRSEVEVKLVATSQNFDENVPEETENSQSKKRKCINKSKSVPKPVYHWSNNLESFNSNAGREDNDEVTNIADNFSLTPVECFEQFFTNEIVEQIVEMSNLMPYNVIIA